MISDIRSWWKHVGPNRELSATHHHRPPSLVSGSYETSMVTSTIGTFLLREAACQVWQLLRTLIW